MSYRLSKPRLNFLSLVLDSEFDMIWLYRSPIPVLLHVEEGGGVAILWVSLRFTLYSNHGTKKQRGPRFYVIIECSFSTLYIMLTQPGWPPLYSCFWLSIWYRPCLRQGVWGWSQFSTTAKHSVFITLFYLSFGLHFTVISLQFLQINRAIAVRFYLVGHCQNSHYVTK